MHMRLIASALALLIACAGHAVEITVTADPPLPIKNLVANPSVEEGDFEPAAWRFGTATPDNFVTRWENTGRTGSRSLRVLTKDKVMSGYWTQAVHVQPGVSYLFSGYYRTSGGRLLIYAKGNYKRDGVAMRLDERFYAGSRRGHWLSPVFLPPEAMTDPTVDEWVRFEIPLSIPPEVSEIALSLGSYFSPGEAWFDDISLAPATTVLKVTVMPWGAPLTGVRVVDDAGEQVYASPEMERIPDVFEFEVESVDASRSYEVIATHRDGTETRVAYPAPGGGGL